MRIFMKGEMLLVRIDPDIKKALKSIAAKEGKSLRELVEEILTDFLESP